jgi:hypothetical protein
LRGLLDVELIDELIQSIQVDPRLESEPVRLDFETTLRRRFARYPKSQSEHPIDYGLQAVTGATHLLTHPRGHIGVECYGGPHVSIMMLHYADVKMTRARPRGATRGVLRRAMPLPSPFDE